MLKGIIVTTLLLFSSPVLAFETGGDEGMEFFNQILENVNEYHLQQTMTKPEDALDDALDNFWNTYEQ